jgi:predicted aconitase
MLVTTSRAVLTEIESQRWAEELGAAGVQIVVDTCTYFTPRPSGVQGLVMTNSAKWAYYAPGILDVEVAFGSLQQCVDSAASGEVRR